MQVKILHFVFEKVFLMMHVYVCNIEAIFCCYYCRKIAVLAA